MGAVAEVSFHAPVLVEAVVEALAPVPPGLIVDGTVGGGGHLLALRKASGAQRYLVGVDRDQEALAEARQRFADDPRVTLIHGSFAQLPSLLSAAGLDADQMVAGILLDLGVSSWQLDTSARGFGLKHPDAPLDMRMDQSSDGATAAELLATMETDALARVLQELGEVRGARRIARTIKAELAAGRMVTSGDLVRAVTASAPRAGGRRIHPATTVFQALRIAVNGELEALDAVLAEALQLLRPGGRMAVISYHSLEDRRVKQAFRLGEKGPPRARRLPPPADWRPVWRVLTRKPIRPDAAELAANPRSRSARLRVAERVGSPNDSVGVAS